MFVPSTTTSPSPSIQPTAPSPAPLYVPSATSCPSTITAPMCAETPAARPSFAPVPRRRNAFGDTGAAAEDSIENLAPASTLTSLTFGKAALPVRRSVPRFTAMKPDVALVRFVKVKV